MNVRFYPLLVMLFTAHTVFAVADTPYYALQHFTDENGLPQNSVKCIAPDSAGFLWMATENGLVRYEGSNGFRVFSKNELGITSSRISYLFPGVGHEGLFARTAFQEILRISNGKAELLEKPGFAADTYEDRAWKSTQDIYPITGLPNVFAPYIGPVLKRYLIPTAGAACFLVSRDSISFMDGQRKVYDFSFPAGNLWNFFTLNNRLYHLSTTGQFVAFNRDTVSHIKLCGDILDAPGYTAGKSRMRLYWNFIARQVFIYLDGACYALQFMEGNRLNTRLILHNIDFESNRIVCTYYDAVNERVFLGSSTKGLFIFTGQQFRSLKSRVPFEDDVYYGQASRGDSLIITPQGIIFNAGGPIGMLPLVREKNVAMDKYSIVIDKPGNIWHKHKKTLRRFNSTGTTLLGQWQFPEFINLVYAGEGDRLWVGTRFNGLYCLSVTAANPVVEHLSAQPLNISWLQETKDFLWIGSEEGLFRMQLSTRRMDSVPGFSDKYIRSLDFSHPGEIWITTYDDGIFLYRNGELVSFPLDRNNYLATAHCMVEDAKGYYWITTNKGLFQVSRQDLLAYADKEQRYVYYHYYGKNNGFNTNEFNGGCQPCAVKLSNGYISLPSLDGLVLFSPARIRPELPYGAMYVGQLELDKQPLACQDTLLLPHDFRRLKMQVSIPYFGDPYNLRVSYALIGSGQDTVWLPIDNDHTLSFSTLPSGTYSLLIRKINGFGKNNYTQRRLLLRVRPAYYETIWFRLLVVLVLIAGVLIYIRIYTHHIKRQNNLLESRVSARTAELQSAMASLTLSEKKLRRQALTQERLLASITHDIKTPMKYLMMLAGNMSWKEPHELEHKTVVKTSKAIYDASYRMFYLLENLIQYIRTHVKNGSAVDETFDLHELLEEKVDIFDSIAESHATRIVNDVLPDLQLVGNYQVLAVVLHNLLDNAVKHTRNGVIKLSAIRDNGRVAVTVEDSGPGLPPSLLHWLNDHHYITGRAEEAMPLHNGMGLIIVLELLELVNGRLTAENKPDKGAMIRIELNTPN